MRVARGAAIFALREGFLFYILAAQKFHLIMEGFLCFLRDHTELINAGPAMLLEDVILQIVQVRNLVG